MVYTLIKFAEREEHCIELQNGLLYMNKIKVFREYRDARGLLRGDPFEGVIGLFQPGKATVTFKGTPIEGISGPILVHDDALLEKHAFCMYSINSKGWGSIREDEVEQFKRDLAIHERVYGLGVYATIFTRADELKSRIETSLDKKGYHYRMNLVDYYDSSAAMGFIDQRKWGLQKRDEYSILNEYRLVIDDRLTQDDQPFRMDVGSLKDISAIVPSADLKDALRIELRE